MFAARVNIHEGVLQSTHCYESVGLFLHFRCRPVCMKWYMLAASSAGGAGALAPGLHSTQQRHLHALEITGVWLCGDQIASFEFALEAGMDVCMKRSCASAVHHGSLKCRRSQHSSVPSSVPKCWFAGRGCVVQDSTLRAMRKDLKLGMDSCVMFHA